MKRLLSNLFKINPIVVKEIRSRMRGPRAFITLTLILLLMGLIMFGILQIILAQARYTNVLSPQIGQMLFAALVFLELFMIVVVTPTVTAGAISGEKEKETYEMLMATPLSASSILWGKLVSALSYVLLLLFAGIPLASVVFIFGGVAPRDMLRALLVLLVIAVSYGILGLFLSALFGRTGRATVASLVMAVVLMFGPIFLAGVIGVLRSSEPPRWVLTPSPISALSATLAPTMGMDAGGSLFYVLSGMFNLGVAPVSQTSIPRPLYHYTIPFYLLLSLILYLLATRLVQPTMRWRIRRKELLIGFGSLLLVVGAIAAAYFATASRYEWAVVKPGTQQMTDARGFPAPAMAAPMAEPAIVQEVVTVQQVEGPGPTPTPTAAQPPAAAGGKSAPEANPAVDEAMQADIYAAIARQIYTIDHTFGNQSPDWPVVYLLSVTNDSVGDPDARKEAPAQLSDAVMTGIEEQLEDLPIEQVKWIEAQNQANIDASTGTVENGNGLIITFGNIHFQEDGSAHVSASMYFASMGASGKTYVLSQVDGVWVISGTTGVEWIS